MAGKTMNKHRLLGVPEIDHQHSELFHSLERLMKAGLNEEAFSEALSRLTRQMHHHFVREERFMAGLDMPETLRREHEQAHSRIIEGLAQIHLDTMLGLRLPVDEVISRVVAYVEHHIIDFDLGLKAFLRPSGGEAASGSGLLA